VTSKSVSAAELLLLVIAGLGAGLVGSIAGLASLISYPVLLAIGLPPVTANVTNTVALVFSSGGSALGSRPELSGQGRRLFRLGVMAVLGGVIGGLLLLITPPGAFQLIVPCIPPPPTSSQFSARRVRLTRVAWTRTSGRIPGGPSATRSGLRVCAGHRPATQSSGDRQNGAVSIPQ
jgi:hypothetical protein